MNSPVKRTILDFADRLTTAADRIRGEINQPHFCLEFIHANASQAEAAATAILNLAVMLKLSDKPEP